MCLVLTKIAPYSETTILNWTTATIHWMALNNVPNIFLDLNSILLLRKTCFRIPHILFLLPTPNASLSLSGRVKYIKRKEGWDGQREGGREGGRREGRPAWHLESQTMFYSAIRIMSARSNCSLSSGFPFHLMGFKLRLHEVVRWLTTLPKPYLLRFKSREERVFFF